MVGDCADVLGGLFVTECCEGVVVVAVVDADVLGGWSKV